jgi:hypothetical protein
MIVLMWILNFAISWANAWGCGKTWNETKHSGGIPRFMNWTGATMSACGFTWCYMVVLSALGQFVSITDDSGVMHTIIPPAVNEAFTSMVYLAIVFPIIGSGIAITVHAWGVAYRERDFGSVAVAVYDTWAQVHNVRGAMKYVPEASGSLKSFFSSDSDDEKEGLVLALVAACLIGGVLTTRAIILRTAKRTALERSFKALGR